MFRTWLDDDDAGLARTMAALDRRLRRGESTIKSFDDAVAGATRIATDLPNVLSQTFGSIFNRRDPNPPPSGTEPNHSKDRPNAV